MTRVLRALGADPGQYFALVRLALRIDMRQSAIGFGWQRKSTKPKLVFFATLLYYLIFGIFFAIFSYGASSIFVGASFTLAAVIFLLGGLILIEYNAIIISPDDFPVLGHLPVSSRTYFLARLTNMLIYVLSFTIILGGPSALVHLLRHGFHPVRGLAMLLAVLGAGLFTCLSLVLLYGQLLRIISPQRLRRALSYVQFIMSFVVYSGYLLLPEFLKMFSTSSTFEPALWMALLPTTWFASWLEIGYGQFAGFSAIGAAIGASALVLLGWNVFSHVSLEYAQRISAFIEASKASPPSTQLGAKRASWISTYIRNPAHRIVGRLVVAQFRHDNKFRFSLVGMAPLLFLYFYLGLRDGALPDPFMTGAQGIHQFLIFFFTVLMLPVILKQSLDTSDAYEASWIFYASPVRLSHVILATRNILFLLLCIPSFLLMLGVFVYYFHNASHAVLHALTILLVSLLFLQIVYLVAPKLPFAEPKVRGGQSRAFAMLFIVLPLSGLLLLTAIAKYFYVSTWHIAGLFLMLLGLILICETLIHQRVRRAAKGLQYPG